MRNRIQVAAITGAAVLALTAGTATVAQSAPRPSRQEIAGLFDKWNTALKGDPQGVAALYAEDAVLLPTLSPVVRTNREQIKDYFTKDFLPKKPTGTITESHIRIVDKDTASHSGNYTFTITDKTGARTKVPARFTYVYEKIRGTWLITEHHSSVAPAG
ncbi:SgcJ/EcaC family oxidoreductase [Kribbella sp. NPDC020789]